MKWQGHPRRRKRQKTQAQQRSAAAKKRAGGRRPPQKEKLKISKNRIAELEAAIEDFEAQMCLEENLQITSNWQSFNEECQNARDELAEVYDKWVEIQE